MTLLTRARKLDGPDREIDAEIYAIVHRAHKPHFLGTQVDEPDTALFFDAAIPWKEIPEYTASLDAIVGLIEAKLPGRSGVVTFGPHLWHRAEFVGARGVEMHEVCRTPALALCALLLAGLNPQETTP